MSKHSKIITQLSFTRNHVRRLRNVYKHVIERIVTDSERILVVLDTCELHEAEAVLKMYV